MHELALVAAAEWAKANARTGCDPVEFGRQVAQVYLAASATHSTAGDEALAAAALAAPSVRPEERKQALNANIGVQVNADGWFSGFGPLAAAPKQSPSQPGASR